MHWKGHVRKPPAIARSNSTLHNSTLSFFSHLEGQSRAALCFEIPGVIYRLGISSLPSPVRPESLQHFFSFFLSPAAPGSACWSNVRVLRKHRREAEDLSQEGGANKQAIVCLVRPAGMSLPLFRDVFRHAGLYVSLPGHSPVSPSQSGLLILSACLPLSLPSCLSPCNLTCAASLLLFRAWLFGWATFGPD